MVYPQRFKAVVLFVVVVVVVLNLTAIAQKVLL